MVARRLSEGIAARVEADGIGLPVMPEVAQRVLALADDPDASAARLSALVHRDPGLAAHVLRIANSAAFGGSASIVTLQQACARLGMRMLSEIAVAIAMSKAFEVPGHQVEIGAVFRRSLAGALWAKEVARIGRRNVESAFLGGLLHRIGVPVAMREAYAEARVSNPAPSPEEIRLAIEGWAPELGSRVAMQWELPAVVCAAIEHHGEPESAGRFSLDVWTVVLGDALAVHGPEALSEHPAVVELNLYPEDLEALLSRQERVETALGAMCS